MTLSIWHYLAGGLTGEIVTAQCVICSQNQVIFVGPTKLIIYGWWGYHISRKDQIKEITKFAFPNFIFLKKTLIWQIQVLGITTSCSFFVHLPLSDFCLFVGFQVWNRLFAFSFFWTNETNEMRLLRSLFVPQERNPIKEISEKLPWKLFRNKNLDLVNLIRSCHF